MSPHKVSAVLRPDQPFTELRESPGRWVNVLNLSLQDIPPFGIMRVVTRNIVDGFFSVDIPNKDGMTAALLVNGPTPIRAETAGQAIMDSWPLTVGFERDNEDGVEPAAGEVWGVKAGNWFLNRHYPGFVAVEDGFNYLVTVRPMEFSFVHAIRRLSNDQNSLGYYPARLLYLNPRTGQVTDSGIDVWEKDLNS